MTEYTAHFRFPIPDFNQEPWHAELIASIRAMDTALYDAILIQDVGNWTNSTVYAIGAIVIDSATGLMWTCAVANTSSVTPTTFAQERVAHPTYWSATANIPQQRGAWVTATSYIPGDFVVESNRYAVCLTAHVSGVFNTDVAAARWVILIDLSSLGVGVNANAEDTIASATTTDLGSKTATRLLVTGVVTITGFGIAANTYKILRFNGVLTLTNSANIILLGGVDRVTAAGDVMFVSSDATGKWREYFYNRASGVPLGQPDASETVKGIAELATQAEINAGTDDLRIVTPLKLVTYVTAQISAAIANLINGAGATLDTLGEIATAIGLLAPKADPTFTGTSTIPTAAITTANVANLNVSGGSTFPAGDITLPDLEQKAKAFQAALVHLRDQVANTVASQGALGGPGFVTRRLQTKVTDELGITLSGNQFILPAGTYYAEGWITLGYNANFGGAGNCTGRSSVRIINVTDGITLVIGETFFIDGDIGVGFAYDFQQPLGIRGRFTLSGTKTIELQNYIANVSSCPFTAGKPVSSGENEIYADLAIWRIG
jgi:hypothetical protein